MTSKVQLDIEVIHADDLGEIVGEFFGSPIRTWDAIDSQRRIDTDRARVLAQGKT